MVKSVRFDQTIHQRIDIKSALHMGRMLTYNTSIPFVNKQAAIYENNIGKIIFQYVQVL